MKIILRMLRQDQTGPIRLVSYFFVYHIIITNTGTNLLFSCKSWKICGLSSVSEQKRRRLLNSLLHHEVANIFLIILLHNKPSKSV